MDYFFQDLRQALEKGDDLHKSALAALETLSMQLIEAKHRSSTTLGVRILEAVEDAVLERKKGLKRHQLRKECVAMVTNVTTRSGRSFTNRGAQLTEDAPNVIIDVRLTVSDPEGGYSPDPGEAQEDV